MATGAKPFFRKFSTWIFKFTSDTMEGEASYMLRFLYAVSKFGKIEPTT